MKRVAFWCLFLVASAISGQVPAGKGSADLRLTYLANEGAMLQSDHSTVLIDAFVAEPYSIYAALSEGTWAHMLAAEAPFEKVDLALVSHRHRDHFQADAALAFLKAHPETVLVSSREFRLKYPRVHIYGNELETFSPAPK